MTKKRIVKLLNCFIVNSFVSKRGIRSSNNLTIQQYNNRKSSEAGFTLVEIIIVIATIAILTSFLVANFTNIKRTSRDAQRKSDLRGIQASLEIYRSDEGSYPSSLPLGNCGDPWSVSGTTYIQAMPCDPLTPSHPAYEYSLLANGNYALRACLENIDDSQRDDVDGGGNDDCPATGQVSYTLQNP